MEDQDYADLGHDTKGKRKSNRGLAPDGTLGRKPMGAHGFPANPEAWGDADYGTTWRGVSRCVAVKKNGQRCRKWAAQGSPTCNKHGSQMQKARNGSERFYGRAVFENKRAGLRAAFDAAMDDPDLTSGREEAALDRAIMGTALAKITPASLEGFDAETAEMLLRMVKDTQALCMGPRQLELKSKDTVSLAEFYLIANGLMDLVYTEIRRLAKSENMAELSIKRIARGLLTMELKGKRVFESEGRDEESVFEGVMERAGYDLGPDDDADPVAGTGDSDTNTGVSTDEPDLARTDRELENDDDGTRHEQGTSSDNGPAEADDSDGSTGPQGRTRRPYFPRPQDYDPNTQPGANTDEES